MTSGSEEATAFIKKYERLAKSKVRSFLARNQRGDALWLGEDLLQAAYIGVVQAYKTYDPSTGVPEHAYVSLKIDYAILQGFDKENPVSARTLAKLRKYQDDKATLESLYERSVTSAELADWVITSDTSLANFLQLATMQVIQVDDESIQNKYFQNGFRLDKFVLRKEIMAIILGVISSLAKREKIIIKALYIDGKSLRETGELIGIRKQSVAEARDRILDKIRRGLEDAGIDL